MKRVSIKLTVACAALLAAAPESNAQPLPMRTLAGNKSSGATNGYGSNARFKCGNLRLCRIAVWLVYRLRKRVR